MDCSFQSGNMITDSSVHIIIRLSKNDSSVITITVYLAIKTFALSMSETPDIMPKLPL
jgi:hypothetical protein